MATRSFDEYLAGVEAFGPPRFAMDMRTLQRRAAFLQDVIDEAGPGESRGLMYDRRELRALTYMLALIRSAHDNNLLVWMERDAYERGDLTKSRCSFHGKAVPSGARTDTKA